MQLLPDERELIRRAFHVEGKAIRQIDLERATCAHLRSLSSIPVRSHLWTVSSACGNLNRTERPSSSQATLHFSSDL